MAIPIIDITALYQSEAFEYYSECPKIITAVTHADKTDDSEFYCRWSGLHYDRETKEFRRYSAKKVFIVPRQRVRQFFDRVYGDYLALKVIPPPDSSLYEGEMFWLFVSIKNPFGFLVPFNGLDLSKYEILNSATTTLPLQAGLVNRLWFLTDVDDIEHDAFA